MAEDILTDLYDKIKTSSAENSANYFYYIIQVKTQHPNLKNYEQTLYIDIKFFINNYIISINKRDFGYDVINMNKIKSAIDKVSDSNQKVSLYIHTHKSLKNNHFEDDAETAIKDIRKMKLKVLKEQNTNWKWLLIFGHLISYNIIAVGSILLISFIISYIIFLPASSDKFAIISLKYINLHDNFHINHFFNLLHYLFNISDKVQINPISWHGVLLVSTMKLFYSACIVNYLYQIVLERIKLNK
ncbi:MAG: hypothetical protein ACRDCN_10920 [Tannerellaceae bacterium]